MYDNIGFLLKVFSRITVKLNKRNASTLLELQNVIKGAYNPMLECQELKVVFEISRCIGELILPMKSHVYPRAFRFYLVLPRVTLESASMIKIHQNLLKLTSIRMSNLKAVCWTNTYQFPLCPCWACWQVALCESLLDLLFQRVAIHICLSPDQLHFLSLFKQRRID